MTTVVHPHHPHIIDFDPDNRSPTITKRLCLAPPPPCRESSFGWGDFPLLMGSYPSYTIPFADVVPAATVVSEEEDDSLGTDTSSSSSSDLSSTTITTDDETTRRPPQPQQHRRKVSFDKVHVRVHAVVLGDHAWAAGGYPLALGWAYDRTETYEVDDYEEAHARFDSPRRHAVRKLSAHARQFQLVALTGASLREVAAQEGARQAAADRQEGYGGEGEQQQGLLRNDSFPQLCESCC
jgi:hypothetical protein